MGAKGDETKLIGQLPGTGGDFIDDTSVEGHRAKSGPSGPEGGDDIYVRNHDGTGFPDEEGDVEGHLYRTGPTTQGEIVMRGPGDNPHGER